MIVVILTKKVILSLILFSNRYADLKQRYLNLESESKFREVEYQKSDKAKLFAEKLQLQSVLKDLSDEVQFLSRKNDQFLKQLKVKSYYQEYARIKKELISLKQAHIVLIQMYNPFKYSDMTSSMIRQSQSIARVSSGRSPATASSSFFSSIFQSSKHVPDNVHNSEVNNASLLDPQQVLHMSPQALKEKLCSPRQERNRFSIWTCGTSKPQPNTNLKSSQAYQNQSFSLSKKNLSIRLNNNEYHSNNPVTNYTMFARPNQDKISPVGRNYNPKNRAIGKYHLSRADQWEASKNLRHLMRKNVNFLHVGNEYGEESESPFLKNYSKKGGDHSYLGSMNTTANQNIASIMGRGSQNQYIDYSIKTPKEESILGKTTGSRSQKNFKYQQTFLRDRSESTNLL